MPLRVDNSHQRLATVLYSTVKSVHLGSVLSCNCIASTTSD